MGAMRPSLSISCGQPSTKLIGLSKEGGEGVREAIVDEDEQIGFQARCRCGYYFFSNI